MNNKKGFTLVELLAVITILGILSLGTIGYVNQMIDKSKKEKLSQQEKTVKMAAESYFQANRSELPKAIGEEKTIELQKLITSKYLKDNVKNGNGIDCTAHSTVTVKKQSKTKYEYTVLLNCE